MESTKSQAVAFVAGVTGIVGVNLLHQLLSRTYGEWKIYGIAKALQQICLQTGIKHYLGSHFTFHGSRTSLPIYFEDQPRQQGASFYYVLEDLLFRAVSEKEGSITWSVHRPGLIIGFSPASFVNAAFALAVYACVCKHEGLPFVFTGLRETWESHLNASDADLIAEHWMLISLPPQAFNISNDDDLIWPTIAKCFGLPALPYDGTSKSLVEILRDKSHVWQDIVHKHSLYPSKLEDLVKGWWILDIVFSKLLCGKSSMEKSINHGFLGRRDSRASFLNEFHYMKKMRFIP